MALVALPLARELLRARTRTRREGRGASDVGTVGGCSVAVLAVALAAAAIAAAAAGPAALAAALAAATLAAAIATCPSVCPAAHALRQHVLGGQQRLLPGWRYRCHWLLVRPRHRLRRLWRCPLRVAAAVAAAHATAFTAAAVAAAHSAAVAATALATADPTAVAAAALASAHAAALASAALAAALAASSVAASLAPASLATTSCVLPVYVLRHRDVVLLCVCLLRGSEPGGCEL